jgi:hypothetical protein
LALPLALALALALALEWTYLNSVTSLKDDFFKIFAGLVQLA